MSVAETRWLSYLFSSPELFGLTLPMIQSPKSILSRSGVPFICTAMDDGQLGGISDEERLVRTYLGTFPKEIDAFETYRLFAHHINQFSLRNNAGILAARFLEKFILWVLCIAQKHLKELRLSDLREFSDFCNAPPHDWTGGRASRFKENQTVLEHNPGWGPFVRAINITLSQNVYRLNKFMCEISHELEFQLRIKISDHRAELREPYVEQDAINAERYIEYVATAHRSTERLECCLLLYATCFYMNIPAPELISNCENFCMACFNFSDPDTAKFTMRGAQNLYNLEVPSPLISHIKRYRIYMQLPPIPSCNEVEPLLPLKKFKCFIYRLPSMHELPCSPATTLKRAIGYRTNTNPHEIRRNRHRAEANRLGRLHWERKSIAQAQLIAVRSEAPKYPENAPSPPPLFALAKRETLILSVEQTGSYVDKNFPLYSRVRALEALDMIRAYACLNKERLKLAAFEKWLLWAIYFTDKPIRALTKNDAKDFLEFCISPPASWCGDSAKPRFSQISQLRVNSYWAPFHALKDSREKAIIRSARIGIWCKSVYRCLIENNHTLLNVFNAP